MVAYPQSVGDQYRSPTSSPRRWVGKRELNPRYDLTSLICTCRIFAQEIPCSPWFYLRILGLRIVGLLYCGFSTVYPHMYFYPHVLLSLTTVYAEGRFLTL